VTLSRPEWEKLRGLREDLRSQLERSEERVAELMQQLSAQQAKSVRLRKQVRLAETRTDKAVAQELDDLETVEDLEEALRVPGEGVGAEAAGQPFAFHGIVEMPPGDWGLLEDIPLDAWEIPHSPPQSVL
jgi:hypothetical protein